MPDEVQTQFMDCVTNIPFVKHMVGPDRKRACELPRDNEGRIIVDVTKPHILEDMDYFRPAALFYKENGCYTFLKPNKAKGSEFQKWFREEKRRCLEGYVRESDGEWVTGYMYFYLNYAIIKLNRQSERTGVWHQVESLPDFWEGVYYGFHAAHQARMRGLHLIELARRGASKSYRIASMLTHNLLLGEDADSVRAVNSILTAYLKEYLGDKDGTLSKFDIMRTFLAQTTEFKRTMLKASASDMTWRQGYKDSSGIIHSNDNIVAGLSIKDDMRKIRGKRGMIFFEEMGAFPGLRDVYSNVMDSVKDGDNVFSFLYLVGTAGDKESDFSGAKTLLYNPDKFGLIAFDNVWDFPGKGTDKFGFFFPAYISRSGCMDENGNSDVTKAIRNILMERWTVKQSGDMDAYLKRVAETCITPAEAILKVKHSYFPVNELNERIRQLDANPRVYDDVYVGTLVETPKGVIFKATDDVPIRKYPVDNTSYGALEIYEMPVLDKDGKPMPRRYILGADPADNDSAESNSLYSIFAFDMFTDRIVAEYTGRRPYADQNHQMAYMMCEFYNGMLLYEAHPYSQHVRLPDGSVAMWKDIKVGDKLLAPNGTTVSVTDIPMEGVDDIYRVTFADGRVVEASAGHLWPVYKYFERHRLSLLTTEYLYKHGVKTASNQSYYFVPESGVVEYEHKDVPIDPYALGLLIAEGAFTKFKKANLHNKKRNYVQFSSTSEDAGFYASVLPYQIKHIGKVGYSWHMYIDDIYTKLSDLGLLQHNSNDKFIPPLYLFNDRKVRLELLRGLMDGDGCAVRKGASVYVTTSARLRDDVMLLCRSLGIKCVEQEPREAKMQLFTTSGKEYFCSKSYRVSVMADLPVFKLPRKVAKQHIYKPGIRGSKASGYLHRNAIQSIEYVGKQPCKCVTVSNPDGLYLIGDYVVTHNCNRKGLYTYFARRRALWRLADCPEYLRTRGLVKYSPFGSAKKGVSVNAGVNSFADERINEWLQKSLIIDVTDEHGEEHQDEIPILYTIRNRALLDELVAYEPDLRKKNVDRIRALSQVMLYREEFIIQYGDSIAESMADTDNLEDDPFFDLDWNRYLEKRRESNNPIG